MTDRTIRIERRFRGPPESGNGGYVCGRLGELFDGPAQVRLRVPPPLEKSLEVRTEGGELRLYDRDTAGETDNVADGETLVAVARAATLDVEVPRAPSFEEAKRASRRYRGFESHTFPTCFVCGPEREEGDGLRIFAGPVEGRALVAAPWIPNEGLGDDAGRVASEFIWAALDCPGASSFDAPEEVARVLGELTVEIRGDVSVGERCVVAGWEIEADGRRHWTGTALFGEVGDCRAVGRAVWFEVS